MVCPHCWCSLGTCRKFLESVGQWLGVGVGRQTLSKMLTSSGSFKAWTAKRICKIGILNWFPEPYEIRLAHLPNTPERTHYFLRRLYINRPCACCLSCVHTEGGRDVLLCSVNCSGNLMEIRGSSLHGSTLSILVNETHLEGKGWGIIDALFSWVIYFLLKSFKSFYNLDVHMT